MRGLQLPRPTTASAVPNPALAALADLKLDADWSKLVATHADAVADLAAHLRLSPSGCITWSGHNGASGAPCFTIKHAAPYRPGRLVASPTQWIVDAFITNSHSVKASRTCGTSWCLNPLHLVVVKRPSRRQRQRAREAVSAAEAQLVA